MGFNVTCSPGMDAAAGYMRLTEHLPALVVYLDPVNFVIQLPPFPGGDRLLAKFCRELAREAVKLADALDQEVARPAGPRHLLDDNAPIAWPSGEAL